ncbi:hypothetical protein GALMADRAFT_148297 [Galerina marginata CBS 339.88]|uniref:Uncharacterized protein n=1 Tax=Galerina marginata (strain CBS 339.88) TaxID=685588 RepID=A0A067SGQ7_GALM3|nr:hypothetical protein GALMADRAFT_148297 [Galerina marginata CBS 339.88]
MAHPNHEDSTVHLLSKKSRRLRRDTFFFMREFTGLHVLIAGLNQRLAPVTCAKLNRWVRFMDKRAFTFELEPVELARSGAVLKYSSVTAGSNIPPESNVPLPAGDYVWHVIVSPEMESSYMPPFSTFLDSATFSELQSGAQVPGELHVGIFGLERTFPDVSPTT